MHPDSIVVDEETNLPTFLKGISHLMFINVGREGVMSDWKFNKLTMDKNGMWFLEVEVSNVTNGNDKNVELTYEASLVLDPSNYNTSIRRLVNKATDSQKEMFKSDEEYLNDLMNIHYNYEKESKMYWIFDFKAVVLKFERKIDCNKIKFIIGTECSEYLSKNFENLKRSSLILKKI